MKYVNGMFKIGLLIVLFGSMAFGQAAPRAYRPGQVVTILISFEGVDAHRFHAAMAYMSIPHDKVRKDQSGLQTELGFGEAQQAGENSIKVSHKVTISDAAGEYKLTQVRLGTGGDSPAWIIYNSEIPEFRITVENDEHLATPKITGVTDVSGH